MQTAVPAPKKKRLSRLEERREVRVKAAASGGGSSGGPGARGAWPLVFVMGRHVLIGREVLAYLEK